MATRDGYDCEWSGIGVINPELAENVGCELWTADERL